MSLTSSLLSRMFSIPGRMTRSPAVPPPIPGTKAAAGSGLPARVGRASRTDPGNITARRPGSFSGLCLGRLVLLVEDREQAEPLELFQGDLERLSIEGPDLFDDLVDVPRRLVPRHEEL